MLDRETIELLVRRWVAGDQDDVIDASVTEGSRVHAAAVAVAICVELDRAERVEFLAALLLRAESERGPTLPEELALLHETSGDDTALLDVAAFAPTRNAAHEAWRLHWGEPGHADD